MYYSLLVVNGLLPLVFHSGSGTPIHRTPKNAHQSLGVFASYNLQVPAKGAEPTLTETERPSIYTTQGPYHKVLYTMSG